MSAGAVNWRSQRQSFWSPPITLESSGLLWQLLADFEKQTGRRVVVIVGRMCWIADGKADRVSLITVGGTEEFCTEGLGLWPALVF